MTSREEFPDSQHNIDPALLASIGERVSAEVALLEQAAEVVGGEGATVEDAFPLPTKERRDAPMPEWADDEDKVAKVREVAHSFGYGAEEDTPSGLQGGRRVLRGGLYWKIIAEEAALTSESGVADITFSGSPNRKLNDAEREAIRADVEAEDLHLTTLEMADVLDEDELVRARVRHDRLGHLLDPDTTEYDMVFTLALNIAEATVADVAVLPYGYEVVPGNKISITDQPTGQYLHMGLTSDGQGVRVLRVDQQMYPGDEPDKQVRSQPDTASLLEFTSHVADGESAPTDAIAVVDSNTYAASVIEAVRASLRDGQHQFGVVMYGRQTLASAKRTNMQPDMPLNQVPGEFRARYISLVSLRDELRQLSADPEAEQ